MVGRRGATRPARAGMLLKQAARAAAPPAVEGLSGDQLGPSMLGAVFAAPPEVPAFAAAAEATAAELHTQPLPATAGVCDELAEATTAGLEEGGQAEASRSSSSHDVRETHAVINLLRRGRVSLDRLIADLELTKWLLQTEILEVMETPWEQSAMLAGQRLGLCAADVFVKQQGVLAWIQVRTEVQMEQETQSSASLANEMMHITARIWDEINEERRMELSRAGRIPQMPPLQASMP